MRVEIVWDQKTNSGSRRGFEELTNHILGRKKKKKNQSWYLCRFIYIPFLCRRQKKKWIVYGRSYVTFFTSKDQPRLACLCGGNNKSLVYNTCRGRHPKTAINLHRRPNSVESLSSFIEAICHHRLQSGHRRPSGLLYNLCSGVFMTSGNCLIQNSQLIPGVLPRQIPTRAVYSSRGSAEVALHNCPGRKSCFYSDGWKTNIDN